MVLHPKKHLSSFQNYFGMNENDHKGAPEQVKCCENSPANAMISLELFSNMEQLLPAFLVIFCSGQFPLVFLLTDPPFIDPSLVWPSSRAALGSPQLCCSGGTLSRVTPALYTSTSHWRPLTALRSKLHHRLGEYIWLSNCSFCFPSDSPFASGLLGLQAL